MWKRHVSMCQGVVLLVGVLLPAHAVANRIQLPAEPAVPTSREQCEHLRSQYTNIYGNLRSQTNQCMRNLEWRDYQQRGATPSCPFKTLAKRCAPIHETTCQVANKRTEAVQSCYDRLSDYRRRVEAEERQARERERQERESRERDARQREAWERQSAADLRPVRIPVRPAPQASARQPERVTRFPAHSGGSSRAQGSEGFTEGLDPKLQAGMARSALRNARDQYVAEIAEALSPALGQYLRGVQSYAPALADFGDVVLNAPSGGTLQAAQQWFERQANFDNMVYNPLSLSAHYSIQNPVARVMMGTSLGVLRDHRAEMLGQTDVLAGMIESLLTSQQQTLPWQSTFQVRSASIGAPSADPMRELNRTLQEVVVALAKERDIRAAENRRVMANAAEARRVEEDRRKRAEEARRAEAARQEQARRNAAQAQAEADRRAREAQRQRELQQQSRQAQPHRPPAFTTGGDDLCAETRRQMERQLQQTLRENSWMDPQQLRQDYRSVLNAIGCR